MVKTMSDNFTAQERDVLAATIILEKLRGIISQEKGWNADAKKKCIAFLETVEITME